MNEETVGKWIRDNSDKFLLTLILFVLLGVTLHVLHHPGDNDAQIQFLDGLTNTISGALIVLVTGAVTRKAQVTATAKDPQSGVVSTSTATDLEKP